MIEKMFEAKFLHLLPEFSGLIDAAILPEFPAEPEVGPLICEKIERYGETE